MKVSKWPVGAVIVCALIFLMSFYGLWSSLGECATAAVIVLLLLLALFVNVSIVRDEK